MSRSNSTLHTLRMSLLRTWRHWTAPPTLGQRGERLAATHLKKKGMLIVARSERSSIGEIDLIAVVDRKLVVFVEVKTREHDRAGTPAEAVDDRKQRKLTRLAMQYISRHGLQDYPARFDVVSVLLPPGGKPVIEHYENAFEATE
jgi:putative endonuclease